MNCDLKTAHKCSSNHKKALLKDTKCGCLHCLALFTPSEIKEWIKDESGKRHAILH